MECWRSGSSQVHAQKKLPLSPSGGELPFELQRRQFPVHLAFAMTINKAQSLGTVGLDL